MSTKPRLTFDVSITTDAAPQAVYALLSDPNTHLVWAGEQAPSEGFRLLEMRSPSNVTVGTRFSSSGANNKRGTMTFHDESVVVEAEPGRRFGFDTESTLKRPVAKTWECRFEHRYAIEPAGGGTRITYKGAVYPQNYRPWWLRSLTRPMTRAMVHSLHRKHMLNLARMAEGVQASR